MVEGQSLKPHPVSNLTCTGLHSARLRHAPRGYIDALNLNRLGQRLASGLRQERGYEEPQEIEQSDQRRPRPITTERNDQGAGNQWPDTRDEARRIENECDRGTAYPGREQLRQPY